MDQPAGNHQSANDQSVNDQSVNGQSVNDQLANNQSVASAAIDHAFLKNLRRMGLVEGISTLVLFGVAMPLKYMADLPVAVRITGSVHGLLFVCLTMMLLTAITRIPISKGMAFAGILAAVVPCGPFVFDRWLAAKDQRIKPHIEGESAMPIRQT